MAPRKRAFCLAAAVAAIALTAAASPAAAAGIHPGPANPPAAASSHQTINITMSTTQEFTAPREVHAGWVTFRVGSADSDYRGFEVVRVNQGHTLAEVLHDLELGLSGDLASNALGARQLV